MHETRVIPAIFGMAKGHQLLSERPFDNQPPSSASKPTRQPQPVPERAE